MRTAADIERLRSESRRQDVEIQGLPPGYIAGGSLTLVVLGGACRVEVDPLIANIRGKQVISSIAYTIVDGDYVSSRVAGNWYYVYLDDAAIFHVDAIAPTYDASAQAYYHPTQSNYRNIGRLYLSDANNYVFCSSQIEVDTEQVLIAASAYQGSDAHYYCTGTADQYLIQAAIVFLSEAYSGGVARFTRGTFSLSGRIDFGYSNINFRGEGRATVFAKNCNDYGFYSVGGEGSEFAHISLDNFTITRDSADTNAKELLYAKYTDHLIVSRVILKDAFYNALYFERCDDYVIRDCFVEDFGGYAGRTYGIYIHNSIGNIVDNIIDNSGATATQGIVGIYCLGGLTKGQVRGNTLHNLYSTKASDIVVGIYGVATVCDMLDNIVDTVVGTGANSYVAGLYTTASQQNLAGNTVQNIANSSTAAQGWGICIASARNQLRNNTVQNNTNIGIGIAAGVSDNVVVGNFCYNNGLDTGIANTNQHNFDDDGTDTQWRGV